MELSKTCRVLYQINVRTNASRWLLLQEYITMHGPLNVKFANKDVREVTNTSNLQKYIYVIIQLCSILIYAKSPDYCFF